MAPDAKGSAASAEGSGQPAFMREAGALAQNDRGSLFAAIGFAAQQLSQEGGSQDGALSGLTENKQRDAFGAYNAAQGRSSGGAASLGPQLVTESGLLMGFGAFDDAARLDVTV